MVSMATGEENYKIQRLSTFLSNELTTKPEKVNIILKQSLLFLFFCTVVSGLKTDHAQCPLRHKNPSFSVK